MLQALEREPNIGGSSIITEDKKDPEKFEERLSSKRYNPHKYLLYRPSVAQILLYLSVATKVICALKPIMIFRKLVRTEL
jgi:hypothetical protein